MPIDFNNVHIFTNSIRQHIVNPQYTVQNQPIQDTFVKSVDVNFDGMKIDKKSFGKIRKQIVQLTSNKEKQNREKKCA